MYSCSECSYTTNIPARIKIHETRKHTTEKPYKCDECDYKCKMKCDLNRHAKIHTDAVFTCKECSYTTVVRENMRQHERIHTGERPFECGLCDYTAKRKSHLDTHMKSHTKIRPYGCGLCLLTFNNTSALNGHITRFHTDNYTYKCDECDFKCKRRYPFEDHLKSHNKRVRIEIETQI